MSTRLLYVLPTLEYTSATRQVSLLAANLPRDEFSVHVCAVDRGGDARAELQQSGAPTTIIGRRWNLDPLAYWRLRRLVRRVQPDVVHTWSFVAGAYGRAAAMAESVPRTVHGMRCMGPGKSRWQRWIDRRLASQTTHLIANSQGTRDYNLAHGMPEHKLRIIPDGVPSSPGSSISRSDLLRTLELPPDARLIGVVDRLRVVERTKELIWAIELVAVIHPAVRLLVVGDGPQREVLEQYAWLASSLDRVRFVRARDEFGWMLPHLDMLWQARSYAGTPHAVLEAMAMGVPVVASDVPGNRALVVDGETGFLVPTGDRAGIARATDRILGNQHLAARLGEAARARAATFFGVDRMVQAYVELYRANEHPTSQRSGLQHSPVTSMLR